MTWRTRWLALTALIGLFLGLLRSQPLLSQLSLSVLLWLLMERIIFAIRVEREISQLHAERTVNGRTGSGGFLWAGRSVDVSLKVVSRGRSPGPMTILRDIIPENLEVLSNGSRIVLAETAAVVRWTYEARVRAAGSLTLPGVRIVMQDKHALFRADRFLPLPATFQVLPAFADAGDVQPIVKRINTLPQHGIHRLQRSGMGSELLELREYVPGDPPKSIAWKVSARRDKLMTRQYESEVPVRVQLMLDGSIGTRMGGFGRRLLDQMTYVAASVARVATQAGDPVGAVLMDERGVEKIPAANGERGFYQLLKAMARFSSNPSPPPLRLTPALIQMALSIVDERFPELLDYRVNYPPFTIFPILPWNRSQFHERCLTASVLATIYKLPVIKQIQLIHDDSLLAVYLQHFVSQSGIAWMDPIVEARGRSGHDALPRLQMLSDAIASSVSHARDNEVFVIMTDLADCVASISHFLPAVKMARARHHRVAVVCPSPTFRRPVPVSTEPQSDRAGDLLAAAEQIRVRDLLVRLKQELGRLGVSVVVSGEQNAIRQIMAQMDIARSGRASSGARR